MQKPIVESLSLFVFQTHISYNTLLSNMWFEALRQANIPLKEEYPVAFLGATTILENLGLNSPENQFEKSGSEHMVIVTNKTVDPKVAKLFSEAAMRKTRFIHLVNAGDPNNNRMEGLTESERKALGDIDKLISTRSVDVVVKLAESCDEFSDQVYRKIFHKKVRARAAQCPGLTLDSLASSGIFTDFDSIRERQIVATQQLSNAKTLHITGNNGTDLTLEFNPSEKVYADPPLDIDLKRRIPEGEEGRGANFPTGEVWRNPLPTANGIIVLDNIDTSVPMYDFSDPRHPRLIENTGKTDAQITISVRNGRISSIVGGDAARSLALYLYRQSQEAAKQGYDPESVYYFGTEVGIGANALVSTYKAGSKVSVVEAEKRVDRMHIALGHSQTEYPFERKDSREYVRGPVHLDFTIPEDYEVEITTNTGEKNLLFGPAGSLDRYRKISTESGVFDRIDPQLNELIPRKYGTYKRMQVDIPDELVRYLNSETIKVIEEVNKIQIIEYDSGKPGDLVVVTSGMHGEETKILPSIDDLDTNMQRAIAWSSYPGMSGEFQSGKIILIPELNRLGTKNLTRYVFEDERETNLNNEFHRYQTGDWNEFLALPSKTARYAWLIMKYLENKSSQHNFGENGKRYLFDWHRDDAVAISYVRIDRMDEDSKKLEDLWNNTSQIGIARFLEYPDWRKMELYQTLTAAAASFGWLAVTIEEGRTETPKLFQSGYVSSELLHFFINQGMIKPNYHVWVDMKRKNQFRNNRVKANRDTRSFSKKQNTTSEILCLDEIMPKIKDKESKNISIDQLIRKALNKNEWDGIIAIDYRGDLFGKSVTSEEETDVGYLIFGSTIAGTHITKVASNNREALLYLPKRSHDFFVVNYPEPPDKNDHICYYGLYYNEIEKQMELRLINGDKWTPSKTKWSHDRRNRLLPQEIKRLLDNRVNIDTNSLKLDCGIPDPIWQGQPKDHRVGLSRKLLRN